MAETTTSEEELSLEEIASHLHDLGDAFSNGEEPNVTVGNKSVTVHPPAEINYEIEVIENSSLLGSETETVTLELRWQPTE
jgi:amphi-Trp domain-containing protein